MIMWDDFARDLKRFRSNYGMRDAAKQIGISPATYQRMESGRAVDAENFMAACFWMDKNPGQYFNPKGSRPNE